MLVGQRDKQSPSTAAGKQRDSTTASGQMDIHIQSIPRGTTGGTDAASLPDVGLFPPFGPEYQSFGELEDGHTSGFSPGWGRFGTWLLNDMNVESWL